MKLQAGPLVVDGILYFTTDTVNYAIDAVTAELKWKYHRHVVSNGGLGVNRGAAYCDGKIIRGASDVHVFARDAATGELIWEVPLPVSSVVGASIPMAPLGWNERVFIGNAGGDQAGVITGDIPMDNRIFIFGL